MEKKAILCVDDEDMVLSSLKRQLRRHFGNEYIIEIAQDGSEALEIIAEFTEKDIALAVIISDYIMPKMRGDELLQMVHAKEPRAVTILLTGQANTEGITNAVNHANLYRYIAKPWEQTDLILTITEALRSYQQDCMLAEHNKALQVANQQLEQLNTTLEAQVAERTAELEHAYKHLKHMHDRMEDDLALARQIQRGLFPPAHMRWHNLDVACYTVSANEVGGDLYRYQTIDDDKSFAIMVGDVSGKGIAAALLMAVSLTLLDASFTERLSPAHRLAALDNAISRYVRSRQQNCALCYVEFTTKEQNNLYATMVNAGCIPPYIRHSNGLVEWYDEVGGFALGQGHGSKQGYHEETVRVEPGDVVILVSDGVIEATNPEGDMFGFERMLYEVAAIPTNGTASQIVVHLVSLVTKFMHNFDPSDDMTIVVARMGNGV